MEAKIKDIYGTEVKVSESCSGYFRLDMLPCEFFPQLKHSVTGEDIPTCLSFNENNARMLLCLLKEYFEED